MDASRFDALARSFAAGASRRGALRFASGGIAGTVALVFAAADLPRIATAKKKGKKVRRNDFGCVNVGRFCKKRSQCCSGICDGKKGKKTCKAHNTGGCRAGQQEVVCGGSEDVACTGSAGFPGVCDTTTGRAGYCTSGGDCFACTKDADCRAFCGADAACIRCEDTCSGTGGTSCVGPESCDFTP